SAQDRRRRYRRTSGRPKTWPTRVLARHARLRSRFDGELASRAVPSDKRQRQRENTQARQQAIAAAQQQAKRRRTFIVGGVIVVLFAIGIVIATQGGDDEKTNVDANATTTTLKVTKVACPPKEGTVERTTTFAGPP